MTILSNCDDDDIFRMCRLDVRQGEHGNWVPGLTSVPVESLQNVFDLLQVADRNRSQTATNMNEHSSRSHMMLTVNVVSENLVTGVVGRGKLNLVSSQPTPRPMHHALISLPPDSRHAAAGGSRRLRAYQQVRGHWAGAQGGAEHQQVAIRPRGRDRSARVQAVARALPQLHSHVPAAGQCLCTGVLVPHLGLTQITHP